MNADEQIVADYLAACEHLHIKRHPDGFNDPPDFLVDGKIAVEARRLNENVEAGTKRKGLEEIAHRHADRIRSLLGRLGPPTRGCSWYVACEYSREFPPRHEVWKRLEAALRTFMESDEPRPMRLEPDSHFSLELFPSGRTYQTFFVLGMHNDLRSGGWLVPEIERNLVCCIEEKCRKIARVQHRYPSWWLALSDHISYGRCDPTKLNLRDKIRSSLPFERVILINPLEPARACDVWPICKHVAK